MKKKLKIYRHALRMPADSNGANLTSGRRSFRNVFAGVNRTNAGKTCRPMPTSKVSK